MNGKVKLSPLGIEYLENRNKSEIVDAVLGSIDRFTAEVLEIDEPMVRIKLAEPLLIDDLPHAKQFSIHIKHLESIGS